MLSSLKDRRQARIWARSNGGLAAASAIGDYQLAATELALARNKADRGLLDFTAFAAREHALLTLMAVARRAFTSRLAGGPRSPVPWAAAGSAFTVPDPRD
jgi:protease PrsW